MKKGVSYTYLAEKENDFLYFICMCVFENLN